MKNKLNKKGQIGITDLYIATAIFILILTTLLFTFNKNNQKIEREIEQKEEIIRLNQITETLIKTKGYPLDWETNISSTESIGLASESNVLDSDKVEAFVNMSSENASRIFGVSNFYFSIESKTGTLLEEKDNSKESENIFSQQRIVYYRGQKSILTFKTYGKN